MRNINQLIGIIKGINFDGVINDMEVERIQSWVNKNRNLAYDPKEIELIHIVDSVLEDHIIDDDERELLLDYSDKFLNDIYDDTSKIYELNGIIEGIVCDGEVNEAEVYHLKEWMDKYGEDIREHKPSVKLCKAIDDILEDGIVTDDEKQQLLEMLSNRIIDLQFETRLGYLCKKVKAKKNIGIDLIDLLDNQDAMNEIHRRAELQLSLALDSYSGTLMKDSDIVFVSLCLIGMLEYDGSFYDGVRKVYSNLYRRYSNQKIEGLIRTVLNKYRSETNEKVGSGNKNTIISIALSNTIVPSHFLGGFFEFIYDIYKINFDYDLPDDLYDEFKFIYEGLKSSMISDGDDIQDKVTKKTYKLIKSTKQLISKENELDSLIKLSIIIVKIIDKKIWNKELNIYNPYLKVGYEKWASKLDTVNDRSQRKTSEWRARWEPKLFLEGNDVYLVPPVHKIKSEYNYWDIYIQILCDGQVIFEDRTPDIRKIIAGYKVSGDKIKLDMPLDNISYKIMGGDKTIYDSKDRLYRKFIVFDKNGIEIKNNTDYNGTAVFCYKNDQEKLNPYFTSKEYNLASSNIKYGDSYFIDDRVFNFSALLKPGIFGDVFENTYLIKKGKSENIKIFKNVKFLAFECENKSKDIEISINGKIYNIFDLVNKCVERDGVCKYTVELELNKADTYDIIVYQYIDEKKKKLADFEFVFDPMFETQCKKLDDNTFVYKVISCLSDTEIKGQIELESFCDESIYKEYKGNTYYYQIPFELDAYRLSQGRWRTLSDELWIGDIDNETIIDIYDTEIDEFIVYASSGIVLDTITMIDKGIYKQAKIGFLCSYKEEYNYTYLALLKEGKVKRVVFCNNRCQMRDETEFAFDTVKRTLTINPWFYGKGNVCCEIFNSKNESVFKKENIENNCIIEVKNLNSYEEYEIVFSEKLKGLGLQFKKNKEIKSYKRVFYAKEDFVGKEFKIFDMYYEDVETKYKRSEIPRSYLRLLGKKDNGEFIGEIYIRDENPNFRSNLVKNVDVDICSEVINGNMEIIILKNDKPLSYDEQRKHVTDLPSNEGGDVIFYTIIVE